MLMVGIVLGIFALLLVVALSGRITVTGEIGTERRAVRIRYLLFTFRIPSEEKADAENLRDEPDKDEKTPEKERSKKKGGGALAWLKLLPEGIQALKHGLVYLFGRLRIDDLRISGTIGSDDPADTGMLIGAIYAVYGALQPWSRRVDLAIAPSFEAERFDVSARGRLSVRLGVLLGMPLVVLWHLPKRKIWRTWRAQRRKRTSQQSSRNARGTEVGI